MREALAAAASGGPGQAVGLLVGVVRAAHEGPGFHVPEAEIERDGLQLAKLVGRVVTLDGKVEAARL